MKRRDDPFTRPLDRHLQAQRLAYGPAAYRPAIEYFDRCAITCPSCSSKGRTAVVTEHGEGGRLSFTCSTGCRADKIAASASSLETFFVDGQDTAILPLHHSVDGWSVKVPLAAFLEAVEARP